MELSLSDMQQYAHTFVSELPKEKGERAYIVGLKGDLGAGKTTFVQFVAGALGVVESVTSPTFVIAQTYNTTHPIFKRLVHIDAYRLSDERADTIGFVPYTENPENLILIEWPEYIPGGFPKGAPLLKFNTLSETLREVSYA